MCMNLDDKRPKKWWNILNMFKRPWCKHVRKNSGTWTKVVLWFSVNMGVEELGRAHKLVSLLVTPSNTNPGWNMRSYYLAVYLKLEIILMIKTLWVIQSNIPQNTTCQKCHLFFFKSFVFLLISPLPCHFPLSYGRIWIRLPSQY